MLLVAINNAARRRRSFETKPDRGSYILCTGRNFFILLRTDYRVQLLIFITDNKQIPPAQVPFNTMSSLRNIARAIPRSLPGISVQCCRRTFTINPRASLLQQSWKLAPRSCYNAFSTSTIARAKEGQGRFR